MTAPALEAQRFGLALVLGAGLGLFYGFLRPLRPRALGDFLFVGAAFWAWLYLGFGICRGDLKFGYTAGLILGAFLWEATAGRLLRGVFRGFWRGIWKILGLIGFPVKKISIFFRKFCIFLLAEAKKWVTIIKEKIRAPSPVPGGVAHGRQKSCKADLSQKQSLDQGSGAGSRRTVYGGTGDPAGLHGRSPG